VYLNDTFCVKSCINFVSKDTFVPKLHQSLLTVKTAVSYITMNAQDWNAG